MESKYKVSIARRGGSCMQITSLVTNLACLASECAIELTLCLTELIDFHHKLWMRN